MGTSFIDYIVADGTVIPQSEQANFSEKIAYLPNSYFPILGDREISTKRHCRTDFGLPPEGFVFCCFNHTQKINPQTFDAWMRIVSRVQESVLWLLSDNSTAKENLRCEAEKRGVTRDRLVFASRVSVSEHLARHKHADLFLDTLPYNAHTTACDALWAGLPVLTQIGNAFAGRVAASLLESIGLPELITRGPKEYEETAVNLATDSEKLSAIRNKLGANRDVKPLFNSKLYTKNLEAVYIQILNRSRNSLLPDHISI